MRVDSAAVRLTRRPTDLGSLSRATALGLVATVRRDIPTAAVEVPGGDAAPTVRPLPSSRSR